MSQPKIVVVVTAVLLSAVPFFRGQNSQSKSSSELPAGAMQQKTSEACLVCHDSRIIVQQRLSKAAWTKEVDKMTKWGAAVDAQDREPMIEYLSSSFGADRPAYQPGRSPSGKSKK